MVLVNKELMPKTHEDLKQWVIRNMTVSSSPMTATNFEAFLSVIMYRWLVTQGLSRMYLNYHEGFQHGSSHFLAPTNINNINNMVVIMANHSLLSSSNNNTKKKNNVLNITIYYCNY